MAAIREWGKKIVVIINKIDLIRDESGRPRSSTSFRTTSSVCSVSRPKSFRSRRCCAAGESAWRAQPVRTGPALGSEPVRALEKYIFETLDEEVAFGSSCSAHSVSASISPTYLKATNDRLTILHDDLATIENIERQLTLSGGHAAAVRIPPDADRKHHRQMNARGDEFFEETIRIGRIFDLLNTTRFGGVRAQGRRRHRGADRRHDR